MALTVVAKDATGATVAQRSVANDNNSMGAAWSGGATDRGLPDAVGADVADAIVKMVDAPFGKRPFRVHVDPSQDGAEVVNAVADRMRREMYRNTDLEVLLSPRMHQRNV